MSFQSNLRKRVRRIRAIPSRFGVREYSVLVRVRTWAGAERGEGAETVTDYPITESDGKPPRVRWLNDEQLALGGYDAGTVKVGPITPGGTPRSALEPSTSGNDDVRWILTGPSYPTGGAFSLKEIDDDRGYQFTVVLEKVAD